MVRMTKKSKQSFYVTEDSFGQTKRVFEFQYQESNEGPSSWNPNTDIFETSDEYVIMIEAAGLNEKTLHLHTVDKRLVVHGERQPITQEPVIRYHQLEIQCMPFQKTIILPDEIDAERVQAGYQDGIVIIRVMK